MRKCKLKIKKKVKILSIPRQRTRIDRITVKRKYRAPSLWRTPMRRVSPTTVSSSHYAATSPSSLVSRVSSQSVARHQRVRLYVSYMSRAVMIA